MGTWPPTQAEIREKYIQSSKKAARFLIDPYSNYRRTSIDHAMTKCSIPLPSKYLRRAKKFRFTIRGSDKIRISLKNFASDLLDLNPETEGIQYLKECNQLMNVVSPDQGWKNIMKKQGIRYTRWLQSVADNVAQKARWLFTGGWRKGYEDKEKSLKK